MKKVVHLFLAIELQILCEYNNELSAGGEFRTFPPHSRTIAFPERESKQMHFVLCMNSFRSDYCFDSLTRWFLSLSFGSSEIRKINPIPRPAKYPEASKRICGSSSLKVSNHCQGVFRSLFLIPSSPSHRMPNATVHDIAFHTFPPRMEASDHFGDAQSSLPAFHPLRLSLRNDSNREWVSQASSAALAVSWPGTILYSWSMH